MAPMPQAKIDPGLRHDLELAEAGGPAVRLPVIVRLVVADAPASEPEARARAQDAARSALRRRLDELGVRERGEWLSLVNGLAIELTPAQIRELARDARVKQIVSNRTEQVVP